MNKQIDLNESIDYSDYYALCDRYRLAVTNMKDSDIAEFNQRISYYSRYWKFEEIYDRYFKLHYTYPCETEINDIRVEYCMILSFIEKIKFVGVRNLSQEFLECYGHVIDDWCIRDGIVQAYDIAYRIHDIENERLE